MKVLMKRSWTSVALVSGLLVTCTAWGRSLSIDLRAPSATTGVPVAVSGARSQRLSASAVADRADGTVRRVNLAAGTASVGEVDIGDELEFMLFDDVKITLRLTDRSPSLLEGDVFLAEASGYDGVKNAVVLRTVDGLTVDIQDFLDDKVYKVISTSSGVTVQEIVSVKDGVKGHDVVPPPIVDSSTVGKKKTKALSAVSGGKLLSVKRGVAQNPLSAESSGGMTYVDILVVYDEPAVWWADSNGGGINNFAQMAVAKMNSALANTGLDACFQFRLVGVMTVDLWVDDIETALFCVSGTQSSYYFREAIERKRNEVGADIVTTFIRASPYCPWSGMAWALTDSSAIGNFESWAYNVCDIYYVNQYHTMTHEVGHNIGAGHSTVQKTQPGPQLYDYSAGYYFTGRNGVRYCTIMSYQSEGPGGKEAPFFSSPNHYYMGTPVGDASHDNTRTIRNTYASVAQWRTRKPNLAPYTPGGWSSPLVVSTSPGTATTGASSRFLDSDSLYVSWAVKCSDDAVTQPFTTTLYVDGKYCESWETSAIKDGGYVHVNGYCVGGLPAGTHTIRMEVWYNYYGDDGYEYGYTDSDSYERTITVARAQGTCAETAVRFAMQPTIATYNVGLVNEWISGSYSSVSGAFFAQTSVAAGRLYTIALPKGTDFTVSCDDSSVKISYGVDDNLRYCLIDTRNMYASEANVTLAVRGAVGEKASIKVVAADYMPLGNSCKPEGLSASSGSGQFRSDMLRSSRGGEYVFSLDAIPGMRYEMRVSGGGVRAIDVLGSHDMLGTSSGEGFCRVFFTCPTGGNIPLCVRASETGQMSVAWFGVDGEKKFRLSLDANGGLSPMSWKNVAYGDRVDELPTPEREGHFFDGWYTAREGGARVMADTVMTVAVDITLYAHWTAFTVGSRESTAIGFAFKQTVAAYPVTLARGWNEKEGRYDDAAGALYCKATVARGKFYTVALPVGQDFEVVCGDAGAVVAYAPCGGLRYCRIDARNLVADTAEIVLSAFGKAGMRTTVYVVEGDLVPAAAVWEGPGTGGLPGSCFGKATTLDFGAAVQAKSVRIVREWDEKEGRYLDGNVHCLTAVVSKAGRLTVAVPAALAGGCGVSCAGNAAAGPELFGGLAFWIFDAKTGDEVRVRIEGMRGADVTVYTFGGDFLAKRLFFDPNGGACPVASKNVRAGSPVGALPTPVRDGFIFRGWHTAREGGALVTAATAMVGSDVTLYAHWEAIAAGSYLGHAISFAFTANVASYPVTLAKEWLENEKRYDETSGVLYCRAPVARGKIYTVALPVGQDFEVACGDAGAVVEYASYGVLRYCRIDARNFVSDAAEIVLVLSGAAGTRTTVYVVEGSLVPAYALYENPGPGGLPGSCLGKATALEFGSEVQARTVRLVQEWDENGARYLDNGVHYFVASAPANGYLTVAVPQAVDCTVVCAGRTISSDENFGGLSFYIFDAKAGDGLTVVISGRCNTDAAIYTFRGDYLAKRLFFDPNGGTCPIASKSVRAGSRVDDLPEPDYRAGYNFLGWFTAREGGAQVTEDTAMVGYDVTLYAHWERITAGACEATAVRFAFTPSVRTYSVSLVKRWNGYSYGYEGVFYCTATLKRGKVYTMAVPWGFDYVNAWCVNGEASVTDGWDDSLRYVRFDTTKMAAEETEAYFAVFDNAGRRTTIYAVEADLMPKN